MNANTHSHTSASEIIRPERNVPFVGLEFSVMPAEEIARGPQVLDSNFEAASGGPYDEGMGVIESFRRCKTCGGTRTECPGHLGHIVLNEPLYHPHFTRPLVHYLRCLCLHCKQCLVTPEGLQLLGFRATEEPWAAVNPIDRVEAIAAMLVKRLSGGMCTRIHPDTGQPCLALIPMQVHVRQRPAHGTGGLPAPGDQKGGLPARRALGGGAGAGDPGTRP